MIRGTTPTLTFELPFDTAILSEAWVTFAQKNKEVFTRELSMCQTEGKTLSVTLTQQETLLLECECTTQIQVRAKTTGGDAVASQIIQVYTERILKDGVIGAD